MTPMQLTSTVLSLRCQCTLTASTKMVLMMRTMLEDMVEDVVIVEQRRALTDTLTRHIRDVLPRTLSLIRDLPTMVNKHQSPIRLPLMDNSCSTLQLATPLLPMLNLRQPNVAIQPEEQNVSTVREEDATLSSTQKTRMMSHALSPMILNHLAIILALQMTPTMETKWKNSS